DKREGGHLSPARIIQSLPALCGDARFIGCDQPAGYFNSRGLRFFLADDTTFEITGDFFKLVAIKRNFALAFSALRRIRSASQWPQQHPQRERGQGCKAQKEQNVIRR